MILPLGLAILLGAATLQAKEQVHVMGQGESLSDVARRYWGEPGWADLLRTHNALRTRSTPRGTRIRVPMPATRKIGPNDTWASIGTLVFGDPAYGGLVARLNHRDLSRKLEPGEIVQLPVLVKYQLGRGETLASLSRRYLSGTQDWPLLAKINRIQNPSRMQAGQSLRIPVVPPTTLTKTSPTPWPSLPGNRATVPAKAVPAPPKKAPGSTAPASGAKTPARVEAILSASVNAYLEGRYEEARDQMEALRSELILRGSQSDRVKLLEHLTFVHVAFDNSESACRSYRALRSVRPKHTWDPDRVSPKVSRTTALCQTR